MSLVKILRSLAHRQNYSLWLLLLLLASTEKLFLVQLRPQQESGSQCHHPKPCASPDLSSRTNRLAVIHTHWRFLTVHARCIPSREWNLCVCNRQVLVYYLFQLLGKNCRLAYFYLMLCCLFIRCLPFFFFFVIVKG